MIDFLYLAHGIQHESNKIRILYNLEHYFVNLDNHFVNLQQHTSTSNRT